MKTKTRKQFRIFIALATFLWCTISISAYAQTPLQLSDFHGTWTGADKVGTPIVITLTDKWGCTFSVNGNPIHAGNPIVVYRLPQYSSNAMADDGAPSPSNILIKFYTQNAMTGARVQASSSGNAGTVTDNNTIEQIYTGTAVITTNASGQLEMAIYADLDNFSPVAPQIDPLDSTPYCTLVKQ